MDDLDWIRRGLEKPGKTQTGLAKALGRSPSMITTLLKGGRLLKVREVGKIAEYLGVEPPTPEPQQARYFLISAIFSDLPLVFSEFQNILLLTPRRPALTAGRLGERGRHGESKRDENREADRGATVALPRICRQVDQDRALDRAG